MKNATITAAESPSYAPDGSRGYTLSISHGGKATGPIRVGDDGRTVYATIDRAPWRTVGTVASPTELTPAWIAAHADAILKSL